MSHVDSLVEQLRDLAGNLVPITFDLGSAP